MASAGRMMAASMALAVRMVEATAPPMSSATLAVEGEDTAFGTTAWWAYAGLSAFLVLFAGLMSGLSLGLMSISLVDLEILLHSGSNAEKAQAGAIFPVVQRQHQLLVTLLLCYACAMEALPIFLDRIFNPVLAIFLSVTFVLALGEVIPQAICARYGLALGASFVWLVRILMAIVYPIAYPIGKLLDFVVGHDESALFRRAQLKALVSIHRKEASKGGDLTCEETTIISGALHLTLKTAEEAMTPIESTFALDMDSKLDWETIAEIISRDHSHVPVYSGNPTNFIGILLVKHLLIVSVAIEPRVCAFSLRRIPRVPTDMPLYDILNQLQKGGSHMAVVVKVKPKNALPHHKTESSLEATEAIQLTAPLLYNTDERSFDTKRQHNVEVNRNKVHSKRLNNTPSNKIPQVLEDMDYGEDISHYKNNVNLEI